MSFFFNGSASRRPPTNDGANALEAAVVLETETIYHEALSQRPALIDEKVKLHERIIDEFNMASLEKLPREELVGVVHTFVSNYVLAEKLSLNQKEQLAFAEEIVDEMIGFGPIEPLLKDPTINDILINSHKQCFVERFGKLEPTTVHFKDEAHLLRIIQ